MNFYDPEGHLLDYRRIEEMAGAQRHLAAYGMLLQPGGGRDGGRAYRSRHARGAGTGREHELCRFLDLVTAAAAKAPAPFVSRSASSATSLTHIGSSNSRKPCATRRGLPSAASCATSRRAALFAMGLSLVTSSGINHACRRRPRRGCAWPSTERKPARRSNARCTSASAATRRAAARAGA